MKLKINNRTSIIFAVFILTGVLSYIFSRSSCAGGLVPCTDDCNLCYLLVGISNIFLYLAGSLLMAAVLLGIVIGGMTFIVSGIFPKALNFAKLAFSVSLKAFVIFLCGWLAINSIMNIVGYKHPAGGKWWQFDCAGNANTQVASTSSNANNANNANNNSNDSANAPAKSTTCNPENKKLESVTIQCAEQKETLADNGSGFFVALDTLSEDDKGKTKQLKALAKYSCDGTTSEEDITAQAEWKASDETQIKVAKGLVQSVTTSLGSSSKTVPYIEAKFQEKSSNQAKVYINSCPSTEITSLGAGNKSYSGLDNILFPKVHAEPNSSFGSSSTNSTGATDPTSETLCAACGQAKTCHWLAGSTALNLKHLFIFIRRDDLSTNELCDAGSKTWGDGKSTWKSFYESAEKFSKGLKYISESYQDDFAVYISEKIGTLDSNCPSAQWSSYGYVQNGDGFKAYEKSGNGYYCATSGEAGNWLGNECYDRIFAHEQIGHAFARLDDEYYEASMNMEPDLFYGMPHYNCTEDSSCTKWGGIKDDCLPGCLYTDTFYYRSSENSIMNKHYLAAGFDEINSYVIRTTADCGEPYDISDTRALKEILKLYPNPSP